MNEKNTHTDFEALIARYLAKEANLEEIVQLESWVQESETNRKLFIKSKRAWQITGNKSSANGFDTHKSWSKIEEEIFAINETSQESKLIKLTPIYRYVATIAAVLAISYFIFISFSGSEQTLMAINDVVTETLPDGSEITLNRNSELVYPKSFDEDVRKVKLRGDAFFSIEKNPNKPFLIETGEITIEVLGTSFYVDAKETGKTIEVTVKTGKVTLKSSDEKHIELIAGEKGIFNKQGKSLAKTHNTNENFLAWKTKNLKFVNTSLGEVFHNIEKTYRVSFQVSNPEILSCQWTATFDNQALKTVLQVLDETFDFEVKLNGAEIIISGDSCE